MNGYKLMVSWKINMRFWRKLNQTKGFYRVKKNILKWWNKQKKDIQINFKRLFNKKRYLAFLGSLLQMKF